MQLNFEKVMERIREVTSTRTQVQLAERLGVRQSSISDAKRRGTVPPAWLLTLQRQLRVNPDWLLTGTGPRYLVPSEDGATPALASEWLPPAPPSPLEELGVPELQAEILKRYAGRGVRVSVVVENLDGQEG